MDKIGITGGSFNPVHIAHLIIAQRFAEHFSLDSIYFIPAWVSPFKAKDEITIAPDHRVSMLRLAILDNPLFKMDLFEIEQKGISYTLDTIGHMRKSHPGAMLHLMTGTDQAARFDEWKSPEEILSCAKLCVARRPSADSESEMKKIENLDVFRNHKPEFFDAPLLEISATEIRARTKKGAAIKYLVTPPVEEYIRMNNLYK
ncbi:MAG: nicotinate (nicotinamide) nucleotide adenylyltransferase [Candidatus Kapaibacterium sp.]